MIFKLKRTWKTDKSTVGLMYAYQDNDLENSILRVFIMEDLERKVKIKGMTAIPCGRYELVWTWSPKFQKQVLMLKDVPNFDRVYFHAGNKSEDTEGCLCSGLIRNADNNLIEMSIPANSAVYRLAGDAMGKGEKVFVEITSIFEPI